MVAPANPRPRHERGVAFAMNGPRSQMSFCFYSRSVVINQYIKVALRGAHYEFLENGEASTDRFRS